MNKFTYQTLAKDLENFLSKNEQFMSALSLRAIVEKT